MTDLAKRLAYNRDIKTYLTQLKHLAGRDVDVHDLLSLDETKVIRDNSKLAFKSLPAHKFKIKFSERLSARFEMFTRKLHALNSSSVYIWLERSNTCGVLAVSSILSFNFKFEFSAISEGIISLSTSDMGDNLLLDFSKAPSGDTFLEIELKGNTWGSCTY